jgi:hypothetical protein
MTFVVQNYDGPPRPRTAIAVVRVDARGPEVVAVDDQPLRVALESPNRMHVEVLPGPHEIDVEVTEPVIGLRHTLPLRFIASPGKVYRVDVVVAPMSVPSPAPNARGYGEVRVYEVDPESDAILAPAQALAPPPAPLEVPRASPPARLPPPAPPGVGESDAGDISQVL